MSGQIEYYGRIRDDPDFNRSLLTMNPQQTINFIKQLDSNKKPRQPKSIEEQIALVKQRKFRENYLPRTLKKEEIIEASEKARTLKAGRRKFRKTRKIRKSRKHKRKYYKK